MTATVQHPSGSTPAVPPPLASASGPGARLRAAREAAGLSLDQVAQQLKLAPRQVRALEEESFGELPGRTFSRGFVRNYARLLNLDPDDLLARLPDAVQAPALEAPALHSTGTMIAELPSASPSKPGFARWLIPLVLVGCIVAAAAYEWYRGGLAPLAELPPPGNAVSQLRPPAAAVTPLPNPLASPDTAPADALPPAPADTPAGGSPIAPEAMSAAVPARLTTPAAPPAVETALVLAYSGPCWTEIRDRSGQLLISRLVPADSVEPVRGAAPFDVVLGNARVVSLTYRGKPIDLTPYTRQNVARLTLP